MSVFQGAQTHNGSFRADSLTMQIGGLSVAGWLVQNVQFQYSQQVAMLYEIGSAFVYYVGGRAQGSANLARIVGPAALANILVTQFSDLCNPKDIELTVASGCGGAANLMTYTLVDAVLTTISAGVTAQDVVVNEQLQFIFIDLYY